MKPYKSPEELRNSIFRKGLEGIHGLEHSAEQVLLAHYLFCLQREVEELKLLINSLCK